jgi:hypothetical protein
MEQDLAARQEAHEFLCTIVTPERAGALVHLALLIENGKAGYLPDAALRQQIWDEMFVFLPRLQRTYTILSYLCAPLTWSCEQKNQTHFGMAVKILPNLALALVNLPDGIRPDINAPYAMRQGETFVAPAVWWVTGCTEDLDLTIALIRASSEVALNTLGSTIDGNILYNLVYKHANYARKGSVRIAPQIQALCDPRVTCDDGSGFHITAPFQMSRLHDLPIRITFKEYLLQQTTHKRGKEMKELIIKTYDRVHSYPGRLTNALRVALDQHLPRDLCNLLPKCLIKTHN